MIMAGAIDKIAILLSVVGSLKIEDLEVPSSVPKVCTGCYYKTIKPADGYCYMFKDRPKACGSFKAI
jgi:hypothetical protein